MVLEKRVLDVPLSGGANEKLDPFLLDPPAVAILQNANYGKTGRIEKRNGFTAQPTTGWSGTAHTIWEHEGQLTALSQYAGLQRLSEANGRWQTPPALDGASGERHPVIPVEVAVSGVNRTTGSILICDVAVTNGVIGYVWIDNGLIFVKVVEIATGVTIVGPVQLTAGGVAIWLRARIVAAGNSLIVLGHDGAAGLYRWVCPTGTLPMAFGASAVVSAAAGLPFECCPGSSLAHLAYRSGGDTVLKNIDTTGTTTLTTTLVGTASQAGIAITRHAIDGTLWLATAGTAAATNLTVLNATTHAVTGGPFAAIAITGAGVHAITVVSTVTGEAFVAHEENPDASTNRRLVGASWTSAGAPGAISSAQGHNLQLVGKAFLQGGRVFIPCGYRPIAAVTTAQPMGLLLTPSPTTLGSGTWARWACEARYLVDRLKPHSTDNNALSSTVAVSSGVYAMVAAAIAGALSLSGVDTVTFTLPGSPSRTAQVGGVSYIASGGLLHVYDGEGTYEAQPHWYPEGHVVTLGGAATGNIEAGTRQWILVWEWEDAAGNLHRSTPSPPSAVMTTVGTDSASIRVMDLTVAGRDGVTAKNLRLALYRTTAGTTSPYYLVRSVVPTPVAGLDGMVDITDGLADTVIVTQGTLYTDGGVLQGNPPPPALDVLVAKGRMLVIDAERRDSVRYSKMLGGISELSASVAAEFPTELELLVPGEDATALATLDDKIVIFTASSIYIVFGDGPLDTGQQDTFSTPQIVSSDQGCIARNSVCSGPFGVLFQSRRGIYLLDRGLQVSYVGAAAEDMLGSSVITSASLIESKNLVVFVLQDSDTAIVWDYLTNTWGKWVFTNQALAQGCIWENAFTYIRGTGNAMQQDSLYSDAGTFITQKIRTAWIKVAGVQGFQRVWRAILLGVRGGGHQLTIRIGYDYVESFTTTKTFTSTEIGAALTALGRYQLGVHIPLQKCQSIRFEFEDSVAEGEPITPNTEGPNLSMLSLEVGVKKGAVKLAALARK